MGSISLPTIGALAASAGEAGADAGAAAGVSTAAAGAASAAAAGAAGAGEVFAGGAAASGILGTGVTATELMGAASLASGVAGAAGSREQSIAQSDDAKQRATQAQLEAGSKQIQIRENMLKALSTQNAAAGAGGIGTGGSFGANVNRQITQNQNDLLALNANTSAQVSQYDSQSASAINQGYAKMGTSLLDTGANILKSS